MLAPVLAAAEARRVVEIGALRGDNTREILETLGPGSLLHVIDPVPGFDPSDHERDHPGRYVFHRARSLDVLGDLPPMDAALIDGDHNWYTVFNELRLLSEGARRHQAPLPLLVLHDVGWPYGRRDLYYAPETIPAEAGQWLIDASVSFTKGCYTGQELVARVDSRGSNTPRRLRLLRAAEQDAAALVTGAALVLDGAEVGTVTSAAAGSPVALAYLKRAVEPPATVRCNGVNVEVEALPVG